MPKQLYITSKPVGRPPVNIAGQRFGRLIAIRPNGQDTGKNMRWYCQCDCGRSHTTLGTSLRSGHTHSCGCKKGGYRHGHCKNPLFDTWYNMLARCTNSKHPSYKDYGGRGIRVCKRWSNFASFLADVGPRPPGLVLDRIHNDGNYTPANVRWTTYKKSNRNSRHFKLTPQLITKLKIAHTQGMTYCKLAARFNLDRHTVSNAIHHLVPRSISIPPEPRSRGLLPSPR